MTNAQTQRDEKFYSLVSTWKRAYAQSLGNVAEYKERLMELNNWDNSGTETERMAKITALQILIHNHL